MACTFASSGLLAFLGVLDFLMGSSFLEQQKFDIAQIRFATQILSLVPQAIIVVLLALLSYGIQTIAVNSTIRRCQAVVVLHDSVEAWRGLGSSVRAVWYSKNYAFPVCYQLFPALIFYSSIFVLHIVTPSLFSVDVVDTQQQIQLTINTMPGNITLSDQAVPTVLEIRAYSAADYLYQQRSYAIAGGPTGVNNTILFGTMDQNLEGVEFEDPTALKLSAKCGIIPRTPGDAFDFDYYRGPRKHDPNGAFILFQLNPKFTPIPGTPLIYGNYPPFMVTIMNHNSGSFVLGGEKPSPASPPPFWCDDRQGSPIHLTKEVQVYTSVSTAHSTRKKVALESVNITFNIWPIGCAMYTQNLTAHVSGSDQKLLGISDIHGYNSQPKHPEIPFEQKLDPTNMVEKSFGFLLMLINVDELLLETPAQTLELHDTTNGEVYTVLTAMPPFTQTTLSALTSTSLNSTSPSLDFLGLEEQLGSYAALSLGLVRMSWQYQQYFNQTYLLEKGNWMPVYTNTTGVYHSIQAIAQVSYVPLIIVNVFSACAIVISFFIVWDAFIVVGAVDKPHLEQIVHDGGLFDMITLLAGSESNSGVMLHHCSNMLDYRQICNAIAQYSGGSLSFQSQSMLQPLESHTVCEPLDRVWTQQHLSKLGTPEVLHSTHLMDLWVMGAGGMSALIIFHVALVILSRTHVLDHLYFNINHLGLMNQILLISEQGFSVIVLGLVTLSISSLACNGSLQKRMSLGALHYRLGAWRQGLGFCFFSLSKVSIQQLMADKIPGLWNNISFSSHWFSDDIADVLSAAPYVLINALFDPNPLGWKQSILFSKLSAPESQRGTFIDPYATKYTASCKTIPQPTENPYTGYSFLKQNESSPPEIPYLVEDLLVLLEPLELDHTGVLSMVHISSSPYALVERGVPLIGSYNLTMPVQMWTYIQNDSVSPSELDHYINATKKLETLNFTLYLWPVACALHILNGTAVVTLDNKLEAFVPAVAETHDPSPGYIRAQEPTHIIEKTWDGLIYLLLNTQISASRQYCNSNDWVGDLIYNGVAAAGGEISALGNQLGLFTATYVAMLDQHWHTKYENQDPINGLSWQPLQGIVHGSNQVLSARFTIHSTQLYFGCFSMLLLSITSVITLQGGFNMKDTMTKEAGVLHCIQMLQWSSLTHLFNKCHLSPDWSSNGPKASKDLLCMDVQCKDFTLDVVHEENDSTLDSLPDFPRTPMATQSVAGGHTSIHSPVLPTFDPLMNSGSSSRNGCLHATSLFPDDFQPAVSIPTPM
ncbi:uncharacterized protein EI90DRAFT_3018382 [Cantharellus anzutake]|uniref:uncharacterized protein n=1 Tax=Cantharellus anzutake TaxID=1750568 RepID=UPI00190680C6|nr:uncharacterized protein EI90DRAFT_3018382 [Cantharellus anzutake]KAF8327008.1 hypothetical protein EI90DRAFT_3018382 [Cantharellus anzutake]